MLGGWQHPVSGVNHEASAEVQIGVLQIRGLVGSGGWGGSPNAQVGVGADAGGRRAVAAPSAVVGLLDDGFGVRVRDPLAFDFLGALAVGVLVGGGGGGTTEGPRGLTPGFGFSLIDALVSENNRMS